MEVYRSKVAVDASDLTATNDFQDENSDSAEEVVREAPPPVVVNPMEDGLEPGQDFVVTRRKLIIDIEARGALFPHVVGHIIPNQAVLSKLSIRQLNDLLRDLKFTISMRNSNQMVQKIAGVSFKLVEEVGPFAGLQLEGFADTMNADPIVKDLVNEIMLEYGAYVNIDPKARLLMAAISNGAAVHTLNTQKAALENEKLRLRNPIAVDPDDIDGL